MKTPIQTSPSSTPSGGQEWRPRPALREAMQLIATIAVDDATAVVGETTMTFENLGERTTISAHPVNLDTCDGFRIDEIVTIRTPLTLFKLFDEKDYSIINIFATTGAVVRDADGRDAVVSRLPLFEGEDAALAGLYTPLIANAARLQLVGPTFGFNEMNGRAEDYDAAYLALPGWDEPSYWAPEEFARAKDRLRERGHWANAGEGGLTVEFPWEPGGVSAMLGHQTSLLTIRADQPHPSAGNGLFYRLDLPTNLSDEEARAWAARLNRLEVDGFDTPPFFGAWCARPGSQTLSFAGFWPNLMYRPGTVTNIAFWSWARSRFARLVIGNLH